MKIHKFKPQRKRDTLLFKLLLLVAGIHVGALLIFGGMIISELVFQPETTFEAPPPPEKVEPKKQFQHKAKQQQQTSNKLVKRIQIPQAKMSGVSSANINLPSSDMAGASLTGGLAPKGFGDLKITMTKVDLLGLSSNTQKIVIVIDASRYMMTDEKGALYTYNVIKDDIKKLINSLPGTVLFNVIAYSLPTPPGKGISINSFNDGLITASPANKERLIAWLDPINASLDKLEVSNNYKLKLPFLPQAPTIIRRKDGYSQEIARLYKPYQAAVEQGADTVYILTAGWIAPSRVKKPLTEKDNEEYRKNVAKLKAEWEANQKAAQAKLTEEQKAEIKAGGNAANEARAKKNAIAMQKAEEWLNAENEKRRKAGKSLNVSTARQIAVEKFGFQQGVAYRAPVFKAPPQENNKPYTATDIIKYYEELLTKEKGEKVKIPVLNMILFKGKSENIVEQSRVAESWVKAHKGKVKVLVGTEL